MKKFIYRISVFTISLFVLLVLNGILGNLESIYYRHWERSFSKLSMSGHLENYNENMLTIGDLSFSNYEIPEDYKYISVKFSTDELGFRNLYFNRSPDLVIIGDSNSYGSRISDEQTYSNILNEKGLKSLNLSGLSVQGFLKMIELGVIKKPRVVVLCQIERNIGLDFIVGDDELRENYLKSLPLINKVFSRIVGMNYLRYLKSRIYNSLKSKNKESYNNEVLFLNGVNPNRKNVRLSVNNLISVKEILNKEEIELLYITIPDKETFYGLVKDDFLYQIHHELKQIGISSLNPIDIFKSLETPPYFNDDTHINAIGHESLSILISRKINKDLSLID